MAVNGIEIQVGQRWRARGGWEVKIEGRTVLHDTFEVSRTMPGHNNYFVRNGRMHETIDCQGDLVELIEAAPVTDQASLDLAIGDSHEALTFHDLMTPESGGWVEWSGGSCPVAGSIEYRMRDGECAKFDALKDSGGWLRWSHNGSRGDIVAYRAITDTDSSEPVQCCDGQIKAGESCQRCGTTALVESPVIDPGRTNPKDAIGDKKAAMHLLSPIAEIHWMIGQYAGMLKYGAWNWRAAGVRSSIYISAARRHLMAYLSGEEFDPVDGSHHLGNVMACAAIMLEARAIGKLVDDRPPSFSHRPTLEWAEDRMAQLKVQYSDKFPRHYTIADTAECFPPVVQRAPADETEGGAV